MDNATNQVAHEILLVDDEPNILSGLARSLHSEGYKVRCVNSGREALSALQARRVDAVVTDQNMPIMKGIDLLAHVANLYPETVRIMLTGEATLDVTLQAINTGQVHRFLVKPCHALELSLALRQQFEQRALLSEAVRLLREARRQKSVLERLERANPGITHVDRDEDGAIELDGADCQQLVEQIRAMFGPTQP
ncbi:MAG: response regulator [Planctomycetes bacterium]|nr:response regulator [Planctomycetota bacterium]